MLFTLEVLPAAEGDCLLLHWEADGVRRLAVIDGGPGRIYENHLQPRLAELAPASGPLPLDLVMVSHMDSDHIVGIKKLVRVARKEVENHVPANQRTLQIKRLWLNVFNDILGDGTDKYYRLFTSSYQASTGGAPNAAVVERIAEAFESRRGMPAEEAKERAFEVGLVLAGHGEGRHLRDDHKFLFDNQQTAALNSPFKDEQGRPTLITLERTPDPVEVSGVEFKIVAPSKAELDALQKEFDAYIEEKGLTAEAVLAAYADDSAKNLSSIVCLATFGGKTILFTGDARGDLVLEGLEASGLVSAGGKLKVDVLKVPHHGSDRNVEQDFFDRISADVYVISGDGEYGNPDRDTLQMIADARGKSAKFEIALTYGVQAIDEIRMAYFAKKNKSWKQDRDSLQVFFDEAQAEGFQFELRAGAPLLVELGDESMED